MTKILIDILPAKGHFHATLKMASKLKNAGYHVVYGSDLNLQNEIEKFGFEFIELPLVSVTRGNFSKRLTRYNDFVAFFYWFLTGEKYRKKKEALNDFNSTITKLNPDLVLLDEQQALKTFCYEVLSKKVVAFQTKPDTRKIEGIPPFTSFYLPKKNRFSPIFCKILWWLKVLSYRYNYRFYPSLGCQCSDGC